VPAKWRPDEAATELTLIVWPNGTQGACLKVLPPSEMAKLRDEINGIPKGDPRRISMKRFVGGESVPVQVDKAGRICLPEEMSRKADIGSEVVMVGMLDRFEIWNPTRFEKVKEADAIVASDAFKMME
jgi:MraZ protein